MKLTHRLTHLSRSLAFGALLAASLTAFTAPAAVAAEPQDIHLSYTVDTAYAVSNIITFNQYADGGTGSWWPSSVGQGVNTIADPFAKSSANAPLSALILGLASDLPGDAAGQTHVVLMMDSAAAAASNRIAWGTLFRNTDEDQLAAQIKFVTGTTRDADGTGNAAQWDASMDALYTFTGGDAKSGILVPPGEAASAWFAFGNVVPGTTTTSDFTVMAFSDGQQIGTGLASVATSAMPIPEPQTYALMLAGLLVIAQTARRRRG
ncbi:hypothetical protein BH11PSE9_BH11PSE9_09930 [soil metagenome]